MGQYSDHTIRLSRKDKKNFSKEKIELLSKSFENFLINITENGYIEREPGEDIIFSGNTKWYEREKDLSEFSKEHSEVLIILDIDYEEDLPDRIYFLNGKSKTYQAEILYYDEEYINDLQ